MQGEKRWTWRESVDVMNVTWGGTNHIGCMRWEDFTGIRALQGMEVMDIAKRLHGPLHNSLTSEHTEGGDEDEDESDDDEDDAMMMRMKVMMTMKM